MSDLTKEEILDWLCAQFSEHFSIPRSEVDPRKSLSTYEISSIYALSLTVDIEEYVKMEVPVTVLWDRDNLQEISELLYSLVSAQGDPHNHARRTISTS